MGLKIQSLWKLFGYICTYVLIVQLCVVYATSILTCLLGYLYITTLLMINTGTLFLGLENRLSEANPNSERQILKFLYVAPSLYLYICRSLGISVGIQYEIRKEKRRSWRGRGGAGSKIPVTSKWAGSREAQGHGDREARGGEELAKINFIWNHHNGIQYYLSQS